MNCEQFENRVQHLLDERVPLSLDLQVRQHTRQCPACRSALAIYDCFSEMPVESGMGASQVAVTPRNWQQRQSHQVRNRMLFAAAALVFLSLVLVARPSVTPPVAKIDRVVAVANPETPRNANADATSPFRFSSFLPAGLGNVASVDFSTISQMDLVSWMPDEPIRVVRNIPVTIQTIEPYYRYSTDFPVLNQWSSGIHSTLGLIQSALPGSSSDPPQEPLRTLDFGHKFSSPVDNRDLC